MAEVTTGEPETVSPAPVAPVGVSFFKREMAGTSFLSFEHFAHMTLVVVVAGLLAAGMTTAIGLWTNSGTVSALSSGFGLSTSIRSTEALAALGVVAALLVVVPLVVVLDRRTRAEWTKRKGYSERVAYKLPIYGALAALLFGKLVADIAMLSVVLQSLTYLGVSGADIGNMYLTQFVPALLSAVVFGTAGWYVFKLAKGQDMGRMFSTAVGVVGLLVAVALLVTAFTVVHDEASGRGLQNYNSRNFEDIFKY